MRTEMARLLLLLAALLAFNHRQACDAQAPPTVESELRRYRIPTTQQGLQAALKDGRPEVRGLAASELASLKSTPSIPLIAEALEREKDQQARFNIASALVWLSSPV